MGRDNQVGRCLKHTIITYIMTFMAKHDTTRTCEQSSVPVSEMEGRSSLKMSSRREIIKLEEQGQPWGRGSWATVYLCKKTTADHSVEHPPFLKMDFLILSGHTVLCYEKLSE